MSFRFTKRWFPLQLRTIRRRLIFGCLLMGAALLSCAFTSSPPLHAQVAHALVSPGTWAATGSMQQPRSGYTATLLKNGLVLVAGGVGPNGNVLASAELYNPATGTWTATGSMLQARYIHTATLLPDGRVLVAGGGLPGSAVLASAELYNPATGTWTATGSLLQARYIHTATLLPDGRVLIAGGFGVSGSIVTTLGTAEIYTPLAGVWTSTGSMLQARYLHTATLLPDGRVLIAGGFG
ncbi:MAG TPA: kelch repeat-containing protein, partial [Ktedonobacteraceae bacterium]|nr:kelch repeat-containing protein [Ktedonobacteraceae bacterium]